MTCAIRLAELADLEQLLEIRRSLSLASADASRSQRGGFLLGSPAELYAKYIAQGSIRLLVCQQQIRAFSLILNDAQLRQSDLMAKRQEARIEGLERLLELKVAYFDQLAALPPYGRWAAALAYGHLRDSFEAHDVMLSTTVIFPVVNRAARPYLDMVGFRVIGEIDERYPEIGRICSSIYLLDKKTFEERRKSALCQWFENRIDKFNIMT